jgi:hypothetical protein
MIAREVLGGSVFLIPSFLSSLRNSYADRSVITSSACIITTYFNPLLPGFTGVLPALHKGQASGV